MTNTPKYFSVKILLCLLLLSAFAQEIFAQTPAFTYQGRLTDGAQAANGTYEMEFRLFGSPAGADQINSTITNNNVQVLNGIFTVNLNFGANAFAAADRFLEISVKKPAEPAFTLLTPRQQIGSSPYSVKTLSATFADSLSNACVGCVDDAKIASISGSKVTGVVANATNATSATNAANANNSAQLGGVAANQFVLTADGRLTNARTPTGAAGGGLTGTYPSPGIANNSISGAQIVDASLRIEDIAVLTSAVTIPPFNLGGASCAVIAGSSASVQAGDLLFYVPPQSSPSGVIFTSAVVETAGSIQLRACNVTNSAIAVPAQSIRVFGLR